MASKADKIAMVKKALAEKAANKRRLVQELLSAAENNPSIKKAAEEKLMTKSALGRLGKVLAQAAKAAPQAGRVARPLAASARNTARALGPNMPQINRLAATPMAGGGNIRRVALPSPRPGRPVPLPGRPGGGNAAPPQAQATPTSFPTALKGPFGAKDFALMGAAGMTPPLMAAGVGALLPQSAYDATLGNLGAINKDWDSDRFALKWQRAGLEGGPMSQIGLGFRQPINTLRHLFGRGKKFDINNIDQYGDETLQKTVMLPNGQMQTINTFQPSEDLQWLMDSGLKQYQMPKQRRSTFDRLLRRPYDY